MRQGCRDIVKLAVQWISWPILPPTARLRSLQTAKHPFTITTSEPAALPENMLLNAPSEMNRPVSRHGSFAHSHWPLLHPNRRTKNRFAPQQLIKPSRKGQSRVSASLPLIAQETRRYCVDSVLLAAAVCQGLPDHHDQTC